jgi:hypothetical protein
MVVVLVVDVDHGVIVLMVVGVLIRNVLIGFLVVVGARVVVVVVVGLGFEVEEVVSDFSSDFSVVFVFFISLLSFLVFCVFEVSFSALRFHHFLF